jgi:hypothetical protein
LAIESDPGRDFAFELSIASRFIAAGYTVTLGGIADAVAHVNQHKIYIESKRIQSTSKIMRRLSEARDQLTSRLKADPSSRARGMIACHVTDIINPEGVKPIYARAEDFRPASENAVWRYVQDNELELRKKLKNKHLGILFESILIGVVYDKDDPSSVPAFMHCRGASMYRYGLGEQDEKLIQSMAPRLANQNVFA